ncbi:PAS domain S-box protein, partial [candidate division KSB1 bacterium]
KRLRLDHDLVTALLNAPMESVTLIDTRGNILAHNKCASQRLGHPGEDLRHQNSFDLVPPKVAAGRKKVLQQVLVTGQPAIYEDVRNDRLLESHIYPVFDAEGKVVQLAVYSNDITDQEKLKSDLEESEIKHRTIFENSQDGINLAKWDANTGKKILVDMNQRYVEFSGYTREELQSGNVYDKQITHLTPKQKEEIEQGWIEGKSSITGEFSWKRPDGKENHIEFNSIPITIGNETYILGIDRDITERKKMETALQESEKRFRELVESLPVIVIETDEEWHIKFANTVAYPSMGLSKSDIQKGYSFLNLVAPKERAKLEKHLHKLEKATELDKFTYKALRKDGSEFPVLAYGRGVTSKKKKLEGMRFVLIELGRESLS